MNANNDYITIGTRKIGKGQLPFIIAELSGNHNQSLQRALLIVEQAAKAGAHALKLQTYTADTMTLDLTDGDFLIDDPASPWYGESLYSLYQKASLPWEWHEPIFKRCKELGLICFSTPFDETAVDFLESYDVPCYKIASFENTDLSLIEKVAKTGKPLIISTGLASIAELDEAVKTARKNGCKELILLKCTSSYPAPPEASNLLTVPHMAQLFNCQVGLSDHTLGIGVSLASIALGATVIERHVTLLRSDGGSDAAFSLEPHELNQLVEESERAWLALGNVNYSLTKQEHASLKFRRSLYIASDIKAGEIFTAENVRKVRPGFGLPARFLNQILGQVSKRDIKRGTPLSLDMISNL